MYLCRSLASLATCRPLWRDDAYEHECLCVAGPADSLVVVFDEDHVIFYDARSGTCTARLQVPGVEFGDTADSNPAGMCF